MNKEITVRQAEDRDMEAFLGFGMWLYENSEYRHLQFSQQKVIKLFVDILSHPAYFAMIAETAEGEPVGGVIMCLQDYYFADGSLATDLALGILPNYRDRSAEILPQFIAGCEEWAKKSGASEVVFSTSTKAHGDKYEPFLNSQGYKTMGFITKKRMT